MKPPGGVEAFTWARAALSVPGPPVAPLDEVPGSFPTVTLMTVCACAAGAEPAIEATAIAAPAISASALLRRSTPRHVLMRKFESIRPDPPIRAAGSGARHAHSAETAGQARRGYQGEGETHNGPPVNRWQTSDLTSLYMCFVLATARRRGGGGGLTAATQGLRLCPSLPCTHAALRADATPRFTASRAGSGRAACCRTEPAARARSHRQCAHRALPASRQ
jgi:hypothetical protein